MRSVERIASTDHLFAQPNLGGICQLATGRTGSGRDTPDNDIEEHVRIAYKGGERKSYGDGEGRKDLLLFRMGKNLIANT